MISIPTGPRAMNEHRPAYDLQAIRALLLDAFTPRTSAASARTACSSAPGAAPCACRPPSTRPRVAAKPLDKPAAALRDGPGVEAFAALRVCVIPFRLKPPLPLGSALCNSPKDREVLLDRVSFGML
jgi:hypothetical protein